jgi:hypothetical protein
MTALVDGKSGRVGLESSECCWRLIPGNSSSAAAAAELQLYSNLQLMLPLFEQLPAEQQQCVLAIAGSMYGNIVQQLQALLPELDPIFRNPTPLALTEQQQQQQQDKLHQVPSLLQPELSMMPLAPVHQQQQVQQQQQHEDQSGSFVLPELSVLVASAQQQQPASQLNASDQAIYALPALQTELSVMPVLQHQQQQQPSGVLQPVLSTIPPHQLLLQQHCLDMYEQDEVTPAAAASTPAAVVPRLSVVASTTGAAAAAAAAATAGCVPPAVSVDPFSVAAAADWGPGMPQAMSVALPPAAAAAAAVVSAAASPGKRDRTAIRQQQQQEDNAYAAAELIRFMASSLSLSEEAPSPKQPKLAVSSSNKARNGSVTNAPWDAARSFSFSLQLPSGMSALSLSLPDLSGISSPLVAVGGSNGFTFGGSIEARTASAEAAPAAAAAAAVDGSCATAMAVDGDTQRAAVHNGAAVAAAKAAGCTGLAMQQALALQHNLLLLTQLLTSGGPSVLFQVFGSSDSSTCSTDAAAIGAGGSPRADQLQEFQLMHQAACDDVQMLFFASAATAAEPGVAAAAAEAGAKAGVASCCGCSICRSAAVAPLGTDSSSFKQQQQQQDLLSGVRLSSSQRRVLQQLLDAAAANHASNYLHLQQQLSWLAAQADLRLPASIASCHAAPLCSAGVASWEAVQSLVEAVQAGCAADATVLQQVMSQAWGPQVGASCIYVSVQLCCCVAAAIYSLFDGYQPSQALSCCTKLTASRLAVLLVHACLSLKSNGLAHLAPPLCLLLLLLPSPAAGAVSAVFGAAGALPGSCPPLPARVLPAATAAGAADAELGDLRSAVACHVCTPVD